MIIKKTAKKLIDICRHWYYHSHSNKIAYKVLNCIESQKTKTDPSLIKMSNDYAIDVLGWKGFAPWLYVYSAIAKTFKEGWIPDNYYGKIVVPKLKGNYGKISEYNALTSKFIESDFSPDCLYLVNGLWLSTDYQILSENNITEVAFKNCEKVVYKKDNSTQGRGVYFFEKNNFDIQTLKLLGNGVLQKFINQHPFFKEIVPNSVATIRITTVITDAGAVSVRCCYLRVGNKSDTHVKSSSHIRIPININNGILDKYGYRTNWIQIESHPDTKYIFYNNKIPNFKKCIKTALKLHKSVPFARTIGWDMIVDECDNVIIMEWNGWHNDIKFSEATQGPCFSDLNWEKLFKNKE